MNALELITCNMDEKTKKSTFEKRAKNNRFVPSWVRGYIKWLILSKKRISSKNYNGIKYNYFSILVNNLVVFKLNDG